MTMNDGTEKTFMGHPRGLATLFFTEMWERFSYYGMRGLLMLFMVAKIDDGGFGFSDGKASAIYGLYTASVYLLALAGGWLADRFIGQRRAVWYGGIIIASGHFSMAVPTEATFYLGLVLIVIGTGLLKPNVSTIVGDLYPEGGARRDAGFSVFYMGINLGAFIGPLLCGWLGENVNWHLGFSLAGIGMVLGLIQYKLTEKHLGHHGVEPKATEGGAEVVKGKTNLALGLGILMVVILGGLHLMGTINLASAQGLAAAAGVIIVTLAIFYFLYLFVAGGFDSDEKKRIGLIAILFLAAAVFWSGFEQAGSSLNLFAKYFTDLEFFGWTAPASWLQSVNPIFIILLAPFFGAMWIKLAQRNLQPSSPAKFAFGLIFLGLGFLVMVGAATFAATSKVSAMWLTMTYLLHTTGELCLSPVGLSTITKLAPKRIVGQMMGIWFLATSLGNLIAGLIAGRFNFSIFEKADEAKDLLDGATSLSPEILGKIDESIIEKVDPSIVSGGDLTAFKQAVAEILEVAKNDSIQQMPDLFWNVVATSVGAGVILFLLVKPIKKLAKGIQ